VEVGVAVIVGVTVGVGDGTGTHSSLFIHDPPSSTTSKPGVLGTCDEQTYTVSKSPTESVADSPLPAHGV